MPADGIPRCPFASDGGVGASRLESSSKQAYTILRPLNDLILGGVRRKQFGQNR
jgi:hypothetical protein